MLNANSSNSAKMNMKLLVVLSTLLASASLASAFQVTSPHYPSATTTTSTSTFPTPVQTTELAYHPNSDIPEDCQTEAFQNSLREMTHSCYEPYQHTWPSSAPWGPTNYASPSPPQPVAVVEAAAAVAPPQPVEAPQPEVPTAQSKFAAFMNVPPSSASPGPSRITDIANMDELADAMLAHKHALTVVRFHAPFCRACKAMAPMWERFARDHPHIQCLQVSYDKTQPGLKEIITALKIRKVPYGQVYHQGALVKEANFAKQYFKDVTTQIVEQSYQMAM